MKNTLDWMGEEGERKGFDMRQPLAETRVALAVNDRGYLGPERTRAKREKKARKDYKKKLQAQRRKRRLIEEREEEEEEPEEPEEPEATTTNVLAAFRYLGHNVAIGRSSEFYKEREYFLQRVSRWIRKRRKRQAVKWIEEHNQPLSELVSTLDDWVEDLDEEEGG